MKHTATAQILEALKRKEHLTARDAYLRWGVMRLASIICNLRIAGHDIRTHMIQNGKTRYGEYYLA